MIITKKLRALFACTFVIALVIIGCSKDEDAPQEQPPTSFADFEYSGSFTGSFYDGSTTSPIEGYVTVHASGATTLDLFQGRLTGTAQKVGTNYNVTITNAVGIFSNITGITGSIDTVARTIYLSGTYPDGSPFTVGGSTPPVMGASDGGWSSLAKSSVVFTHSESCKASVTVNGITFSGLNAHYEEGGMCSPYYAMTNQLMFNYDDNVSELHCHNYTLLMMDGTYQTFTDCNTAQFIVDKNTQYTYTVAWENGEITTGTFTSAGGGGSVYICPSNDGPDCSGEGEFVGEDGNPRFNLQFTNGGNVDMDLYVETPNGSVIYYGNTEEQGGTLDVDCGCGSCPNGFAENVFWQNGSGPSGQYKYYVKYYGSCSGSAQPSTYTLRVINNNNVVQTQTGTLSSGQSPVYTYTHN